MIHQQLCRCRSIRTLMGMGAEQVVRECTFTLW
jgi:hypothetical protein